MPRRRTHLGRRTRRAEAARRVIANQTEEERASAHERDRRRMAQMRANETAEQRAARLEDARLRARRSRSAASDLLRSQLNERNRQRVAERRQRETADQHRTQLGAQQPHNYSPDRTFQRFGSAPQWNTSKERLTELETHSKSTEETHRPAKTMEHSSLQEPQSILGHINLEDEGEEQISPSDLSCQSLPSPTGPPPQGLNGLPVAGKRAHIPAGTTGTGQGETSRLERCLLIDSQGLPSTVLVEEQVESAEVTAGGTEGGGSGGSLRKAYSCPVCSRTFEYLSYLQRHSITHSENKPHVCRACGKAFKRASHLERHEYTHSVRKPHQCPTCQRSFRDSGELLHHQQVHTGEWPYQCEACHMRFVENNSLQRHIIRKHRQQVLPKP